MEARSVMTFNPSDHFMKLKGKDYLPVAARLVWFRDVYPEGLVEVEHITITDDHAIFRSTVTAIKDGEVKGRATDYGSESKRDFGDFIEKASTKATGRALAALGFGTLHAPELDEGARIVDSPVERPQPARNAPKPANTTPDTSAPANLDRTRVTKALHAEAKKHGLEHIDLHNLIVAKGHESIATAPVDALIDLGKAVKNEPNRLKEWLAQRHLDQQELMPGTDAVPNPDRFTS